MIKSWHYVITGFLQNRATETRFTKLWMLLHEKHLFPDTAVQQMSWNINWRDEAERVCRLSEFGPSLTVRVYGYSWGGGWGAMQFAGRLRERGVDVRAMVLVDPVYRHPYWFGNWRAFFPWVRIVIPDNVQEVWWFRQKESLPRGHDLCAQDDAAQTIIHEPTWLKVTHENMDDQPVVIRKCMEVSLINGNI